MTHEEMSLLLDSQPVCRLVFFQVIYKLGLVFGPQAVHTKSGLREQRLMRNVIKRNETFCFYCINLQFDIFALLHNILKQPNTPNYLQCV